MSEAARGDWTMYGTDDSDVGLLSAAQPILTLKIGTTADVCSLKHCWVIRK